MICKMQYDTTIKIQSRDSHQRIFVMRVIVLAKKGKRSFKNHGAYDDAINYPGSLVDMNGTFPNFKKNNYFTSSDPHHDMLGGGCQVRVVIENMMGRMENLRTLISGFLGLVILVRWALVTMFLS